MTENIANIYPKMLELFILLYTKTLTNYKKSQ